ncbi:MAG TPA: T9SS type A sorting domain-containing protein, partial [Chitinophagaceae bacterium]|nr:T9SS type A sorting domain-containing protein [Chitinophagaceae bacterium]
FSDHLQVIMKNEIQGETLIITDIQGRILEKVWADKREIQLDTKKWQKGIYFLKNRQESIKVIKQ